MWQLGAGALIAVWSEQLSRIWPRVRLIIAYASMVLIVIALFGMDSFINAGYPYPGIPSLLPTIGAAGLIVAGLGGILKSLVSGFLSSWPMQAIGEVSYSWYLWHWPFLVFAKVLWPEINSQQLMWVALSALVVATISLYVVENPVRYAEFFKSKPLRTYSLAVGLMGATLMSSYWLGTQDAVELEKNTVISYSPTASEAVNDIPALYDLGCMNTSTAAWVNIEKQCIFGDLDGDRIAVLYGDSHAAHWFGGLNEAAKAQGVQLHLRLKSFCTPVDVARWDENRRQVYAECEVWKERVLENLTDLQPDFIFWGARSSGSISVVKNGEQIFGRDETRIWRNSLKRTMQDLLDTGAKVIAIADNPFAPYSMPGCVSENPGEPNLCNFSRKEGGLSRFDLPALRAVPDVVVVDFVDRFCSKQECFAVVEDTFVYRDMGHITDTFSRTFVTDFVALLSEPVTS